MPRRLRGLQTLLEVEVAHTGRVLGLVVHCHYYTKKIGHGPCCRQFLFQQIAAGRMGFPEITDGRLTVDYN